MIDTRVVSQELQDKILEQVRKGQEQVRKGQETMAEALAVRRAEEVRRRGA